MLKKISTSVRIQIFCYVHAMFGIGTPGPFFLNTHLYSNQLILNELPIRWRGRYNEDTDLCLQTLALKWCTVSFNAFLIQKVSTMLMKGGNTDELYKDDGRTQMARYLERKWPGVVSTASRFNRAQHVIKNHWKNFDTPLIRRKDIDWEEIKHKKHDITLVKKKEIKSKTLEKYYKKRVLSSSK